jgi:VanZ family protein
VRYPGIDKILHLLAYGVLASLAAALATFGWGGKPQRLFALGCLLAGFAMLDELTQPIFGRQAEFADWLADCLGITGGILGVLLLRRWLGRYFQQEAINDG